jgi:hypothetical protein
VLYLENSGAREAGCAAGRGLATILSANFLFWDSYRSMAEFFVACRVAKTYVSPEISPRVSPEILLGVSPGSSFRFWCELPGELMTFSKSFSIWSISGCSRKTALANLPAGGLVRSKRGGMGRGKGRVKKGRVKKGRVKKGRVKKGRVKKGE